MRKLEVAEEKLIAGVISDSAYSRIKDRVNEQLGNIEDELYKLDRKKNLKMDVIQETLRLVRDVGSTYRNAVPELKRFYLGLFWDQFTVANKTIVRANKSPLIAALEALGSISFNKIVRSPIQAENLTPETMVQISSTLGQDSSTYLTVLCDHEYMRGIQEKIRLIHAFQRDEKIAEKVA